MAKQMQKRMGGGNAMTFGKSNAKIYAESETGKTFADVAGQEEAKDALKEIVDFLHNPQKYSDIGASLQRAHCWSALRVPVRRFLPERWPARHTYRSFPSPVQSLWRCLWVWERQR